MLTLDILTKLEVDPANGAKYLDAIRAACALRGVDTPERMAGFLGQCIVESVHMQRVEEGLYYSTASRLVFVFKSRIPTEGVAALYLRNPQRLANFVYSNRYGNGNEASGDGWKYRGRGLIQTTFKANYEDAEKDTGRPYVSQPDLLLQPSDAALAAVSFYVRKGCIAKADKQDWDGITSAVNPARLEAAKRKALSIKALQLLS